METTTLDHDPAARARVREARDLLAPCLGDSATTALDRAESIATIVAFFTPETEAVAGSLLYSLWSQKLISDEAAGRAPAAIIGFAKALLKLGRLDTVSMAPASASPSRWSGAQAETVRRMLLATVADPRLVLARLAEQLWSLREARHLNAEERARLGVQTRDLYGPLANRLGLGLLKWELEDYAFRYLQPDEYRKIAHSLAERRSDRERYLDVLCRELGTELTAAGITHDIQGRPKHIYSIWRKMTRKGLPFERVFDIRALRILVDTVPECYATLGIVHGRYPYLPGEFDDYIATPKGNGYRSIHTAVRGPGDKVVEVQIRTHDMHDKAELGLAAHWRYKEGRDRDGSFERKVEKLRELLAPRSDADTDPLDSLGPALFQDRIYVLSPRGDVIELPEGSTPLDFAYHVHTDLGHRCRGARVDQRMTTLDRQLRNGETVEVITGKTPNPSRDWLVESLGFLSSKSARAKVRAWFRDTDRDEHLKAGRAIANEVLARHTGAPPAVIDALASHLHLPDTEALYVALGAGDLSANQLMAAMQRLERTEHALDAPAAISRSERPEDEAEGLSVMGVSDLLCHYARCCRPVPPEQIIGYVTLGKGVTIHRTDCGNVERLRLKQPDRVLPVSWGHTPNQRYPAELIVVAFDRRGLVRDVTSLLADAKISIDEMHTVTHPTDRTAEMALRVHVHDLLELDHLVTRISALPDVIRVRRR